MELDHIALAAFAVPPVLDRLVAEFGATVLQGAEQAGFRPVQVRVGDADHGMTVELLEPFRVEEFDFLDRFLRTRGEGPHHLTFKVDDLATEVERLRAAGFTPTGVLLDSPRWKEAFLTPAEAHGTVVQLAQGGLEFPSFAAQFATARADGPYGEPRWWPDPPPRAEPPAVLERVEVSTPRLEPTAAFYTEVVRGTVTGRGPDPWVDVDWGVGGCIRIKEDPTRPAGISHLELRGSGSPREIVLAGTRMRIRPA